MQLLYKLFLFLLLNDCISELELNLSSLFMTNSFYKQMTSLFPGEQQSQDALPPRRGEVGRVRASRPGGGGRGGGAPSGAVPGCGVGVAQSRGHSQAGRLSGGRRATRGNVGPRRRVRNVDPFKNLRFLLIPGSLNIPITAFFFIRCFVFRLYRTILFSRLLLRLCLILLFSTPYPKAVVSDKIKLHKIY